MIQEILMSWAIPGHVLSFSEPLVHIAISKDKQYWTAWAKQPVPEELKKGRTRGWSCPIHVEFEDDKWETVRLYIISHLLPTLINYPLYNDLDRFTDLE